MQVELFYCSIITPILNPELHGTLSEKDLAEAFFAEVRSIDVFSTDYDSSAEGSVGGESSLLESSDRDDVTGDESDDDSTRFHTNYA